MLATELIQQAVFGAAQILAADVSGSTGRSEERLRVALEHAITTASPDVALQREWRPEMPYWPWKGEKKLGGFDLALTFPERTAPSVVAELKWATRSGIDALDEVLWDLFKTAHAAATLQGVEAGYLIYAARSSAWSKPARFAELFEAFSVTPTRRLIDNNPGVWRWALGTGSSSRPTRLPPYVETHPWGRARLKIDGDLFEMRAVRVAANGEPWIELDVEGWPAPEEAAAVMDWPVPDAGPWMEPDSPTQAFRWPGDPRPVANDALTPDHIPSPTASWMEIMWLAASFDGYSYYGGTDELMGASNRVSRHFFETGALDGRLGLSGLRAMLFAEYRRHHHYGHAPDAGSSRYIRALLEAIRTRVH